MIEIKNRWTGAVIYRSETATTVREAVIELASKAPADGSDANLAGADLARANLAGADLARADLARANLADANLARADLARADLARANLAGANLARANLADANLARADLARANLADANLADANLADANLAGANLARADLREIRDDVWEVLDAAPNEVAALLFAVREGRINGSAYFGPCACLVGTIANVRACNVYDLPTEIQPDASRLAERWFLGMKPGDTPEHHPVSLITAEWIEEWMVAHDMPVPRAVSHEQAHAFVRANMANFEAFVAHEKKPKASEL